MGLILGHNEIFKRVRQFTSTPVETPQAKAWEVSELSRRGIQKFNRTKPITFSARLQQMQEEAKKMKGPDPCWKGYQMVGKKKKNGREVPNCVPVEEEKQGHALVVNNKIVARDAKHRLVSLAKEKHGKMISKKKHQISINMAASIKILKISLWVKANHQIVNGEQNHSQQSIKKAHQANIQLSKKKYYHLAQVMFMVQQQA